MNFDPEAKALELERELRAMDEAHQINRSKYLKAIQALRGSLPVVDLDSMSQTTMPTLTGMSLLSYAGPDRLQVVDMAVRDYPREFTTTQLRDFIKERYPKQAEEMQGSYLSTRLADMRRAGKLVLVSAGVNGNPSVWRKAP